VRQRRLTPIVLAALAAALVGRPAPPRSGQVMTATVVRAVDGDTLRVRTGGREFSVRLLGIDTPETHRPGTPVECGGPQASAAMAALAPPGRRVELEPDPGQDRVDRYGRLLAYVRVPGGRLIEDDQLRAGWASVYVYGGRPVSRYRSFIAEERAARAARRGVFGACAGDFHSAGR
jgi:micrococcal nuclease